MKAMIDLFAAMVLLAATGSALAALRYVDINSANPAPPFTNWATAATNIQDAVDAAVAGDQIVVTNGIYATGARTVDGYTTNRVAVDKPLSLRSINGPQFTTINGGGSVRCVYLTNGASLSGFTLTNGSAPIGGGLWCESTNAVVYNCVIARNSAYYGTGGGAYRGTLNNCTLSYNSADGPIRGAGGDASGGGASECTLNNCVLSGNSAWGAYIGWGGGASGCILNNCTLTGNYARGDLFPDINGEGGGAAGCTLNNCMVYCNNAGQWGAPNCSSCTLNYCCTTPDAGGVGNITNAPLFVDQAWPWANLRLQSNSPCINAGLNALAPAGPDLAGFPRIKGGTVDMGAYEFPVLHYVVLNSTNATLPYTNWITAATNIQEAVDAAVAGDEIVVTNGVYSTGGRDGNRVEVDKPLSVRSANGPQLTFIDGAQSVRCVYLTNGACLSGFTLINGRASGELGGGGVFGESVTASVSNCVISANSVDTYGGGGGACGVTLNNCTLSGNRAWTGVHLGGNASGGGAADSILNYCTLSGNLAEGQYVGVGGGAVGCTLNNCLLSQNSARGDLSPDVNSFGGAAYGCTLNNCSLSGNVASWGGGASGCVLNNCISYYNTPNTEPQGANYDSYCTLNYCCTTPLPTSGIGNITNAPLFMDQPSGNLRLQSYSPCINAGLNALAPAGPDLDGNLRIKGATVDIGAYEFQSPTSMISYGWLQQYGLPTDGTADTADPDGDGLNNWQEWQCGTDPTNALSALRLLTPVPVGSGLAVSWQSVAGVSYFLERSTTASSGFMPLATGIPGQPGTTTTFTDTNAIGAGPFFYRVGVSAP